MEQLLKRGPSLQIRSIQYAVAKHLQRDPGCRTGAAHHFRSYIRYYTHALVMFDKSGCGVDASRTEIQDDVEQDLFTNGWRNRAKVIVIDPELQTWIWTASNRVSSLLGWKGGGYAEMRRWLADEGLWATNSFKPTDPKRALEVVLRKAKRPSSSSLFGELAESVTLRHCQNPAFIELKDTRSSWFPRTEDD